MIEKFGIDLELITVNFKKKLEEVKQDINETSQKIKDKIQLGPDGKLGQFKEKLDLGYNLDINERKQALADLENQLVNLKNDYWSPVREEEIQRTKREIEELKATIEQMETPTAKFGSTLSHWVDIAKQKFADLKNRTKETKEVIEKTTSNTDRFGKMIKGTFNKGVRDLKRFSLALFGVQSVYRAFTKISSTYMSQNVETANKMRAIWGALASLVGPVIDKVANGVISIITYINQLIQKITGINLLAKAMANYDKNIKKAGKSAKSLAGIDEITNLDSQNDNLDWTDAFKNVDTSKIDSAFDKIKGKVLEIKDAFVKIWESDDIQYLVNSFRISFDNIKQLFVGIWQDLGATVSTWGKPIWDAISNLFGSIWNDVLSPWLKLATDTWKDFTEILLNLWEEHGKPLLDSIGEFVHSTIGLFQKIWDDIIAPILTPFLEELRSLWEKHLKGVITKIGDFVMVLIEYANKIWSKFIQPLVSFILDFLSPAWSFLSSVVVGVLGTIAGVVSDVFGGVISILKGIVGLIAGEFTSDWKKAWTGIGDIFTGIWESIVGVAKGVINLLIDALNGFIRGINKISWDVPDWVPGIGGKKWGFNLKTIAKLDVGTNYVPSDQLAMIHEGEAVVPKKFNSDQFFNRGNEETNDLLQELINVVENKSTDVYLDKKKIGESVRKYIDSSDRIMGRSYA